MRKVIFCLSSRLGLLERAIERRRLKVTKLDKDDLSRLWRVHQLSTQVARRSCNDLTVTVSHVYIVIHANQEQQIEVNDGHAKARTQ